MSTYNIWFHRELRKLSLNYHQILLLNNSSDYNMVCAMYRDALMHMQTVNPDKSAHPSGLIRAFTVHLEEEPPGPNCLKHC